MSMSMDELKKLHQQISNYIKENWKKSFNEPTGVLKYKFMDPAANYRAQLWDWDSYFCAMGLKDVYENTAEYIQGCALNFLEHQRADGSIPYMINLAKPNVALPDLSLQVRDEKCDLNSIKPLLAQMCLMTVGRLEDDSWIRENYDGLKRHIAHWEQTQQLQNGLFVWRSYRGSGTDNHPALYGRPLNSSAGVDLNCFMYQEYLAMAEIAEICQDTGMAEEYGQKARMLADTINKHMWDPIDEIYYHLDALSAKPPLARQEVFWDVPLKFKTWTSFLPMYAGIAPREYADKLVKKHILNEEEFWSNYGIRTLAKNEPVYNLEETGNPSNWQGPIWIISTYLIFKGLLNYGYFEEAKQVAENLLRNLCRDLEENGALHEYYNPETGISNINLGFMNWNALVGLMVPELEAHQKVIGVINWDCSLPEDTYFGSWISKTLSPEQYRNRVPYYADRLADGTVTFRCRTLEEYEQEMQLAIDIGIDYFAYCWYGADSTKQLPALTEGPARLVDDHVHELTFARKLHVQSALKSQLKLCAILSIAHPYTEEELTDLAEHMKQAYYQDVKGQPLVYIYGNVQLRQIITRLHETCKTVGAKTPYVVLLTDALSLPKEAEGLIDAVSEYACVKDGIREYAQLTDAVLQGNSNRAQCGVDVIPHFSVGWNPQPRITNPVPWVVYNEEGHVQDITEDEYLDAAERLLEWMKEHRDVIHNNHILTFAWNEFEEGGYICPTVKEDDSMDTSRLKAFARVIEKWHEMSLQI